MESYQLGRGRERIGETIKGFRSIIGRRKRDRGMLRTAWKWRSQRTYMQGQGLLEGRGILGGGEGKREKLGQL